MKIAKDIDSYIADIEDSHVRKLLHQMRSIVNKAAPKAEECISYGMPAVRQNRVLVYFAAAKKHIGFYPTGTGIEAFKDQLADYQWSKGAIQFPFDKPLPAGLITKIVKFKAKEDEHQAPPKRKTDAKTKPRRSKLP